MLKKINFIFLLLLFVVYQSCSENVGIRNQNETLLLAEKNHLSLLQSSIEKIPYSKYKSVIFTDSLGTEIEFSIVTKDNYIDSINQTILFNGQESITSNECFYTSQRKKFILVNETFELDFLVELFIAPDEKNICNINRIRDELVIYALMHKKYSEIGEYEDYVWNTAFSDIVDKRNSKFETEYQVDSLSQMTIREKKFYRVLKNSNISQIDPYSVIFNYEYGIISFEDWENRKVWVFKKFTN